MYWHFQPFGPQRSNDEAFRENRFMRTWTYRSLTIDNQPTNQATTNNNRHRIQSGGYQLIINVSTIGLFSFSRSAIGSGEKTCGCVFCGLKHQEMHTNCSNRYHLWMAPCSWPLSSSSNPKRLHHHRCWSAQRYCNSPKESASRVFLSNAPNFVLTFMIQSWMSSRKMRLRAPSSS